MKSSWATNIKSFRVKSGLSQKALSESAEINHRHFQEIESGRVDVKQSTVCQIARILQVPTCYLFQENLCSTLVKEDILCKIEILDFLPTGVLLFDKHGKIIYSNRTFRRSFYAGSKSSLLHGRMHVWDLIYGDESAKEDARLRFLNIRENSTEPQPAIWTYRGPKDKPIKVLVIWDYIKNQRNQITNYIASLIKIEDLNCMTK